MCSSSSQVGITVRSSGHRPQCEPASIRPSKVSKHVFIYKRTRRDGTQQHGQVLICEPPPMVNICGGRELEWPSGEHKLEAIDEETVSSSVAPLIANAGANTNPLYQGCYVPRATDAGVGCCDSRYLSHFPVCNLLRVLWEHVSSFSIPSPDSLKSILTRRCFQAVESPSHPPASLLTRNLRVDECHISHRPALQRGECRVVCRLGPERAPSR